MTVVDKIADELEGLFGGGTRLGRDDDFAVGVADKPVERQADGDKVGLAGGTRGKDATPGRAGESPINDVAFDPREGRVEVPPAILPEFGDEELVIGQELEGPLVAAFYGEVAEGVGRQVPVSLSGSSDTGGRVRPDSLSP